MGTPNLTLVGWLAGITVPPSCSSGNSPDFYNEATGQLFTCAGNVYVPVTGTGGTPISGGITTQTSFTGSRQQNTVYQNTTGKPVFELVSVSGTPVLVPAVQVFTDANNPPTTVVAQVPALVTSDIAATIGFWVLRGNFFEVVVGNGPQVDVWTEWS